ncbi:MAG: oxidoreductase [Bacteroidales bacterium]|jgi:NAD(P)-dependent dehydrogenase (short-subunit alcohol dehydrogenase family)|nr:oxidoreductase [Bacteroidales bacterium]
MKKWTNNNIPDLSGKVIIVTGGNSGLGYASVKAFSENGARVVMACRSCEKGENAKGRIGKVKGEVVVMSLDLSVPNSIRQFAKAYKKRFSQLDVLLNNAGVMMRPYELSSLGIESQLATNHLGHFMLTSLLLDVIVSTPRSRVVGVSSLAHRKGALHLDDINYNDGQDYDPMVAYRRSKLANLYFAYELQRFFDAHNVDAISVVAHPGVAPTNLMNHQFSKVGKFFIRPLAILLLQRVSVGALGQIRAAVDPQVRGAEFYGPSGRKGWKGSPVLVESTAAAHDEVLAKQLWKISEALTACEFSLKGL